MNRFGDRLREMRTKHQITQKALGRIFQLSESAIGMYERNQREPSLDLVTRFADFFHVTTGYLLGHSPAAEAVSESTVPYLIAPEAHCLKFQRKLEPLSRDEAEYLWEALVTYRTQQNRQRREP